MKYELSPHIAEQLHVLKQFMEEEVFPNESLYEEQLKEGNIHWNILPIIEGLKLQAKKLGLWNLFLHTGEDGLSLTNYEYAFFVKRVNRRVRYLHEK